MTQFCTGENRGLGFVHHTAHSLHCSHAGACIGSWGVFIYKSLEGSVDGRFSFAIQDSGHLVDRNIIVVLHDIYLGHIVKLVHTLPEKLYSLGMCTVGGIKRLSVFAGLGAAVGVWVIALGAFELLQLGELLSEPMWEVWVGP